MGKATNDITNMGNIYVLYIYIYVLINIIYVVNIYVKVVLALERPGFDVTLFLDSRAAKQCGSSSFKMSSLDIQ